MILYYRGDIEYCNYSCGYCPFGKNNKMEKESIEKEKEDLKKFFDWVKSSGINNISIIFTPKGELSHFEFYKNFILSLDQLANVKKIVLQTNLSGDYKFLTFSKKVSIWATFHPCHIPYENFLKKTELLIHSNIPFSIGAVAIKEDLDVLKSLREHLGKNRYFWLNAYKDEKDYYSEDDIKAFEDIDPLFRSNLKDYDSLGKECFTGEDVFLILGNGDIRRCHLNKNVIGNIFKDNILDLSKVSNCENKICDCYISYIHLKEEDLRKPYGQRFLERIKR